MSATEDFFILDSENSLVGDKPEVQKTAKGSFGSAARKRLGDISNLPQRPKPSIQDEKEQFVSNTTKEYIDHLQMENMTLMKLLVDRNKIIELSGLELQKLRINFQKMQQQNLQLAQSNSQMLMELNSGKDRLKVLQHEVGCKNGLLKAKKLELKEKAEITCQKTDTQEGTSKSEEARESSEADRADNEQFNTNRKQQSKTLGPCTAKQVQLKEKTEKKSASLRRQSARFKPAEPEQTEEMFEVDDVKFPVCSLHDDQMQEDGSTSMCSSVEKDDKGGSSGPSDDEAQECPSTVKHVQLKEKTEKKRSCLRRQSARLKHKESDPTEEMFEIDDAKFSACSLHDDQMQEDGSTSMCSSAKADKRGISGPSDDKTQELQRSSSIGRPSRLAAKKVQSYKEIPVNVKMRRKE